jgi:AraC-like DNA-binding protein
MPMPRSAIPSGADAHHLTDATVVPNVARSLLGLLRERGLPPGRVCRGLGFGYRDLFDLGMRLSYRQTRLLIVRSYQALQDPALGLSAGARQTPVSWGLPGLAMLTCETLGEAIDYGLAHQGDAGALVEHVSSIQRDETVLQVRPRLFDVAIEPFLVEEAFSSAVAVVRCLVGPGFSPRRAELAYPRPAHARAYTQFFRCPVHFGAGANRLVSDTQWLGAALPGYDEITCQPLRAQLDGFLRRPERRSDLVESIASRLRAHLDQPQPLQAVAQELNMSERTLRRRLTEQGQSFQGLMDAIRHERARDLLQHAGLPVAEVALACGFADARSFRRAFKRWSGALPGKRRKAP